ncbi:hypothetical protein O6H91_11G064600 [Diphasiastrum complanatum]|uniref:Uncharacterized protein n=1 Tax=Diphasiastrum complanatum TaxID=34168 RepID=A0ACC2C9W0_DIPCM|nr:hypothetical protein O6H91_11G064600 [Diphasiastrum complanatum]
MAKSIIENSQHCQHKQDSLSLHNTEANFSNGLRIKGNMVSGIGTMVVTPILGYLSDEYGRKPLLMVPLVAAVLPMAVLAYSRTKTYVYIFFILRTIVAMFSEGSLTCLALAYVGDTVEERFRAPAVGIMTASLSSGFVTGVIFARVLPESQVFKIAAAMLAISALYLKVFLVEINYCLPASNQASGEQKSLSLKLRASLSRSTLSITETLQIVQRNKILMQVSFITFVSNLGEAGVQSSLLYYLKATFNFGKDQFADLMLIAGIVAVFSQLAVMPVLIHILGEKSVLCLGLFAAFTNALLYGIAWAPWVPYLAASLGVFSIFVFPCTGSIVSKAAGPEEQGKLQGFVASVRSLSSIISPLAMSPLTALFLSDHAPFHCPGFSLICAALAMLVAAVQGSVMERLSPPFPSTNAYSRVQVFPTTEAVLPHPAEFAIDD